MKRNNLTASQSIERRASTAQTTVWVYNRRIPHRVGRADTPANE